MRKALCFSLGPGLLILALQCSAQGLNDGTYSGQYTGTIVNGGQSEPTAGVVQFVVANNVGTMSLPGPGTGTGFNAYLAQFSNVIVGNASCNFSGGFRGNPYQGIAYTVGGPFSCSSPDGAISGSWSANRSGDGATAITAILPATVGSSGEYIFNNVPGKLWFDPPAASAFEYTMTSGSLFTSILDFPNFFDNPFTVSTGGVVLGTFIDTQSLVFPNGGVSDFIVSGITPVAVPGNTAAFALKLDFNTPTASFTQKQICLYTLTVGPVNTIIGDFNTISLGGLAFTSQGGSGTVTITTDTNCPWTIGTPPAGVVLTSASSGTGSATVTFQVLPNSGGDLNGSFAIAGQTFTVEQQAPAISGLNFVGAMAHLAAEENWTSTFTLVNKSAASATARLSFFGDALDPSGNGPLTLPLTLPQQPSASSGAFLADSFDQTLAPNASLIGITAGLQTQPGQLPPVLVGSAQLAATGPVDGFVIFHQILTAQEAVVPMETRNASSYLLAFDNTNGLVLGVAVENVSAQNAVIPVIIRDDAGNVISPAGTTISLGGNGHTAFVLSDPALGFPVTANKRGTIEFDTPSGGRISVLGLRFSPPNNALTTIPALANVGTGGGSIAHLASGGDGWQTTFVLVNTGTGAAPATLSFFADMTGAPLSLPLSFPQAGGGTTMTVPSYTTQLAAGATLVIVSNGAPSLLTGSAQLTTTGHISGFVIYRHNNQEAVVPLESRNANAYVLAFDNTNGISTGIAVNNASAQAGSVPVTIRDDTGAQIATDTLNLNPNGHVAFTLVTDKYPATANIRGTIEFDAPAGAQIGALGIRIPPTQTYTTLPALAK
jgi:hypothetical protein